MQAKTRKSGYRKSTESAGVTDIRPLDFDVLIAGAGIAGLALARELHRRNASFVAIEQRHVLADAGLAINLPGNAIAALRELGLGDDLSRHGSPVARRDYRSSSGRLLFSIDEVALWGVDNTPRCMRRADLAALLTQDIPESAFLRACSVTSATIGDDGVEIRTAEGHALSGEYLVGADGVHSTVRKWCLPDSTTSVAHLADKSWRFIASNPGVDCWTVWMGKSAIILLIPCGPNEVYGWATISGRIADDNDLSKLVDHSHGFPLMVRKVLDEAVATPQAVFLSPLNEVRPSQWGRGRAILIGDAAHATAPVWAQGAALALEDSLVLARLLSEQTDPSRLTEKFAGMRQARVGHVQKMTDRASKASRLPGYLRNALFEIFGPRIYSNTYGPLRYPIT